MPRSSPYRQLSLTLLAPAPDHPDPLAAARSALAAADRAERVDRHRATAALATHLAGVAQARGRTPIPKPGRRSLLDATRS